MSDETPESPFKVGQRAYWIATERDVIWMGLPPIRYVANGVVVSTGPAVTQIWHDSDSNDYSDYRDHHMMTIANDKLWVDEAVPAGLVLERYQREKAAREKAEEMQAAREATSTDDGSQSAEGDPPSRPPKRRRWF